jgi:hypothetical protein
MNYQKFINSFKIGISNNKFDLQTISYFRKDSVSLSIWVCLLERHYNNNNNNNNIENILKDLSNVTASRPKFFKIINNAISKSYLIKEANKNDKRKFNIYLSKQSIKEFEAWALLFKSL